MKLGRDSELNAKLINEITKGVILEFAFRGIHEHAWSHGNEIIDYIKRETDKCKPNAILLNFLDYQYAFGNELMGTIFTPLLDLKDKSLRPIVIVAQGSTAESIESLVSASNIRWVMNIEIFKDREIALEKLGELLSHPPGS